MMTILRLQAELAACYVRGVAHMMRLPRLLRQPTELSAALAELEPGAAIEVDVPVAEVEAYNKLMARTKASCLAAGPHLWLRDYEKQLLPAMLLLRLVATAVALWWGPSAAWVAVALLAAQLVVAPLSLVPAVSTLVALAQPMFVGHYVVYPCLSWVLEAVTTAVGFPSLASASVTINATSIGCLMLADQLLCLGALFWNPNGTPVAVKRERLLRSVMFGFVDCKTYPLLILGLLQGFRVNVLVLSVDWAIGLSAVVRGAVDATGYNWCSLFYPQHRIAHLPCVYQHAHKFHHTLEGTTPFDAHLYGHGMPEELLCLVLEYAGAALLGIPPPSLSTATLLESAGDKVSHTLKEVNKDGCNAHPEHHIYHTKNYGIGDMGIDLLHGTCADVNGSYPAAHGCTVACERITGFGDSTNVLRVSYRKELPHGSRTGH